MTFAGKFVFFYGDEGCQKGEIVEQIGDDLVLIRWDRMHGDPDAHDAALVCVGISEMITMYVDAEMLPQCLDHRPAPRGVAAAGAPEVALEVSAGDELGARKVLVRLPTNKSLHLVVVGVVDAAVGRVVARHDAAVARLDAVG